MAQRPRSWSWRLSDYSQPIAWGRTPISVPTPQDKGNGFACVESRGLADHGWADPALLAASSAKDGVAGRSTSQPDLQTDGDLGAVDLSQIQNTFCRHLDLLCSAA